MYLLVLYASISSLREVSHHHVNCTNSDIFVDPNVSYECLLSRNKLPNVALPHPNIVLRSMGLHGVLREFFGQHSI